MSASDKIFAGYLNYIPVPIREVLARRIEDELHKARLAPADPGPTLGIRERAFHAFITSDAGRSAAAYDLSPEREFFKAGWQARKELDYKMMLGIKPARETLDLILREARDHGTTHEH